jgi:hypothetical protein
MHHECKEPLGKGLPHQGPRVALFQCESTCSTSRLSIELNVFSTLEFDKEQGRD